MVMHTNNVLQKTFMVHFVVVIFQFKNLISKLIL